MKISSFFRFFTRETKRRDDTLASGDLRITIYFFLPFILVGGYIIYLHATSWVGAATSLLWALACLACGAAIGFLFGIPKILQADKPAVPEQPTGSSYRQQVNTNLEQISDWLTKIIVGLGLINLKSIPPNLNRIAEVLTASTGTGNENTAFALALILYFSIIGFLFGYVSTRLFLAGAFSRADQYAAAIIEVEARERELAPNLLKQVLSKTSPSELLKGESSYKEERALEPVATQDEDVDEGDVAETGEREEITAELKKLNNTI